MQSTLHEHVLHLEHVIQALTDQLTDPRRKPSERDRFNYELRMAEISLRYYRKAFELEQRQIN
jgi:hypothetical protein